MKFMPEACVDKWKCLHDFSKTKLLSVRRYLARRRLEANLALLIDAARGHQAQKLISGSRAYLILHRKSEELVSAFSERWQVSLEQLNAELPVLDKLRQLAHNTPQQQTRAATVGLVVLSIAACLEGQVPDPLQQPVTRKAHIRKLDLPPKMRQPGWNAPLR